jgi:hypothetical protein
MSSSTSLLLTPASITAWIFSLVPSDKYESAQHASVSTCTKYRAVSCHTKIAVVKYTCCVRHKITCRESKLCHLNFLAKHEHSEEEPRGHKNSKDATCLLISGVNESCQSRKCGLDQLKRRLRLSSARNAHNQGHWELLRLFTHVST